MDRIAWQKSESIEVGIFLALTGGILDAYSFLVRGGVFANAQTGNIVLLGVYLAQRQFGRAAHYIVPIVAFAVGIVMAEAIKTYYHRRQNTALHWRQVVIGIEIFLLILVAFLPQSMNTLANVLVSFVCSLQVQTFRRIHNITCATTMCTGNLRSGVAALYQYSQTKSKEDLNNGLGYLGVDLVFLVGAVAGAFAAFSWAEKSVLVSCGLLFLVFLVMFIRENEK